MLDSLWAKISTKLVGGPFRPFNEVDQEDAALKAQWWSPVAVTAMPSLLITAIIVVVAIPLAFIPLILLVLYALWLRKKNAVAVNATRLSIMRALQEHAAGRASNQIEVDLGITLPEIEDAKTNNVLLHMGIGSDPNPFAPDIDIQHPQQSILDC